MRKTCWITFFGLAGLLMLCPLKGLGAQLQPKTLDAYERYVRAAEARMKRDDQQPGHLLYIDSLPAADRNQILASLKQGDIYVTDLTTRDQKGNQISAPGGWIHHWLAAMYVPGATIQDARHIGQNYDKYSTYYKPEMTRSRVLRHSDDTYEVYARLQKKTPWVTITLDTYSDVHYYFLGPRRVYTVSHFFRIQQVEDAGTPQEHLDPPGDGSGFLWAMDVYWRYKAVKGGILVESETIALSRGLPFGLGWIVKPFIHRSVIATDKELMNRTRQIIEQAAKEASQSAKPRTDQRQKAKP